MVKESQHVEKNSVAKLVQRSDCFGLTLEMLHRLPQDCLVITPLARHVFWNYQTRSAVLGSL